MASIGRQLQQRVADASKFHLFPQNVGILAMEAYIPSYYVSQEELEKFDGVSAGKYTVGLGQLGMAFVTDREDIYSISMTAVANLMEKYNISYHDIGRLEVATETILDHSKSIKTVLMQLFTDSGNTDIEGVDSYNACYAGTNALFNSLAWIESSAWDGRYALVVAADIAEYAKGPARPTGGCAAVAFLVGPNAPIVFERGCRASHMEHVYDFYKPHLDSPYPVVDGKYSNVCYLRSLDQTYNIFAQKFKLLHKQDFDLSMVDHAVFHAPYNKLVQKAFSRLSYNDFKRNPEAPVFKDLKQLQAVPLEQSYEDKNIESAFMALTQADYKKKVSPTTLLPQNVGNTYTAALYAGLLSLVATNADALAGKRILMFSYGSGLAASMFSAFVPNTDSAKSALKKIQSVVNLNTRLNARKRVDPAHYSQQVMSVREGLHKIGSFVPSGPVEDLFSGTFYLTKKDDLARRYYERRSAL